MLSGKAIALVITAICIGAVGMGISTFLGHDQRLEPATYIRYALVLTIGVYVVVGGLIAVRLVPGIKLRWHTGKPASSILMGAAFGGTLSGLLLAAVSGAAGHLSPDPRIVTLMSEGDIAHIVATVGITCLAAPLIEEVLFRGLLLESLRRQSGRVALWVSGFAFAVWHLNPAALRYYALMGAFLGVLYMKRGLVCSMAAHAAFNGVLTVAALAVVLAPATTVSSGDISISAPGGWHQHNDATFASGGLTLEGPSESALLVAELPTTSTPTPDTMLSRIQAGLLSVNGFDLEVHAETAREVQLPVGQAVEVDIQAKGHAGTLVYVPRPGAIVEVVFMSAGSMKARSDFPHMLDSLRVA